MEEPIFDYSELKGRIIAKYENLGEFAKAIGYSRSRLSTVLKSGKALNSNVVYKMVDKLEIPTSDIGLFFYTIKV